ncbi:MAG TPA: hypothetical protein VNZ52_14090, partial [Candidatus Thermoplasmatota archaeon]|nr:hypothetical protein [Candidatus Thermoplasmatota archaeon]
MTAHTPTFVKTLGFSREREFQARRFWRVTALTLGAFAVAIFGKALLHLDPVTPLSHGLGYALFALIGFSAGWTQPAGPMDGEMAVLLTRGYGLLMAMLVGMAVTGATVVGALN